MIPSLNVLLVKCSFTHIDSKEIGYGSSAWTIKMTYGQT